MAAALHFYRDGIGLEVLFDIAVDSNLEPLLGAVTGTWRTVFLGDRQQPRAGVVELIDLDNGAVPVGAPAAGLPHRGAFLISFVVPVTETLQRLAVLGLGGEPRTMRIPGGGIAAVVVDPDGVMVELLDRAASF